MPKCCSAKQKKKKKKMVAPLFTPPYHQKGIRRMPTRKGAQAVSHQNKKKRSPSINERDWQVGCILGKGHFGCVVQARNVQTKEIVAWKRFSTPRLKAATKQDSRILELVEREIQIHQSLNHPNILPFLGYAVDKEHVTLVLELSDLGDLFEYSTQNCTSCVDRARLFHQVYPSILAAASYLESLQIAHRDIKPENILLKTVHANGQSTSIQPQLSDFGWSVWYLKAGARQSTLCGTPEDVPPELLRGLEEATPTSRRLYAAEFVDPWALGVLALEMLQGGTPFGAPAGCPASKVRSEIFTKIRSFERLDRWARKDLNDLAASAVTHGSILPRAAMQTWKQSRDCPYVSLIDDFLQINPCRRVSATECLERHADLFGAVSLPTLPRPSVRQRRQIFQNNHSVIVPSLIF